MLWENPNIRSGLETINPADVGAPEDVAGIIACLASEDAAFVQGAMVRADGGRLHPLGMKDKNLIYKRGEPIPATGEK